MCQLSPDDSIFWRRRKSNQLILALTSPAFVLQAWLWAPFPTAMAEEKFCWRVILFLNQQLWVRLCK